MEVHSTGSGDGEAVLGRLGVFGSMRFGTEHGVVLMAQQLKVALAERGASLQIINMTAGGDIDRQVFETIEQCDTFLVFGSAKYGEETANQACTYFEYKHAFAMKKKLVLIRMIPFDQQHEELQARVIFGANKLVLSWMLGQPMPADLPDDIMKAMGLGDEVERWNQAAAQRRLEEAEATKAAEEAAVAAKEAAVAGGRAHLEADAEGEGRGLRVLITRGAGRERVAGLGAVKTNDTRNHVNSAAPGQARQANASRRKKGRRGHNERQTAHPDSQCAEEYCWSSIVWVCGTGAAGRGG
jgi:hypothetical protein